MRTTLDALRSLKKYTAMTLGPEWEVRLSYQEGAFTRPFCRVEEAGPSIETGPAREGMVIQPFSLMCHPVESDSADAARLEAGNVAELLRTGFRLGVGGFDAPSNVAATPFAGGGALMADTYRYAVVSTHRHRESLPSATVSAVLAADGHVRLTWDAVGGATGYRIYRDTVGGPALRVLAQVSTRPAPVGVRATSYAYGGELAAGTYDYVVTALLPAGEARPALTVRVVTTGATGRVELAWPAVAQASGYRVYRGPTSGPLTLLGGAPSAQYSDRGTVAPGTATPPTATSFVDDGSRTLTPTGVPLVEKGTLGMPARVPLWDWSGVPFTETSVARHPADYLRVRDFSVRVIADPQDEMRIAVAADVRMGWRRSGRLPFSGAPASEVSLDINIGA